MKHHLFSFALAAAFIVFTLGCGMISSVKDTALGEANSNKTLTDRAVDTAVGEEKIGVPECDEVLGLIAAEANSPDDNFVTKAAKAAVLNRIRTAIKESIEKNKNDKVELAKNCREFKTQLEKYKNSEKANSSK